MAIKEAIPANLAAGQFYGAVPEKRVVASSILTEIIHHDRFNLPEHSHELAYFTLVLGGSYIESFGRKTDEHAPMTLLWHRAGIFHKDRIGESGARCFTIEIQKSGMDSLEQLTKVPLDFAEIGTPLVWTAARLFSEFKYWGDCSELIVEGLTLEMLGHAARRSSRIERRPPKWLGTIVERLEADFSERVSTSELAEDAGVHPVHLASVFRKFHGETIGEHVQRRRVRHASKLLGLPEMPLADIAYACGFSDQSHFTRIFKRCVGMTPGAFRTSLS